MGVELTAECKQLMVVQQDRLGRSLDRLSTELYSKDAHFVLELIQVPVKRLSPEPFDALPVRTHSMVDKHYSAQP